MAINSKAKAAAPAQAAAPAPRLTLQLATAVRLVEVGGALYENHMAYSFSLEDAQAKLQQTDDYGVPVWKVYKAPAQRPVDSTREAPAVVMAEAAVVAATESETATDITPAPTKVKVMEIGSPEEEAELGLPPADESGNVTV